MNEQERKIYARTLVMAASQRDQPGLGVMATGMTIARRKLQWRVNAIVEQVQPYRSFVIIFTLISSLNLLCAFATSETETQLKQGVYLPLEEHIRQTHWKEDYPFLVRRRPLNMREV